KAVRRRGDQPPCRAGHPRPGRSQGPLQGGGRLLAGPTRKGRSPAGVASRRADSRWQRSARKGADCRAPARDCRPRPALSLVGAVAPAAAWQGGCRRARAVANCARVATATAQRGQGES
ncbi:hypothetical protein BHM03_00047269, partial [Ensete ventricosum]